MSNQSNGTRDQVFDGEADVRALFESSAPVAPAFDIDSLPPMDSPTKTQSRTPSWSSKASASRTSDPIENGGFGQDDNP